MNRINNRLDKFTKLRAIAVIFVMLFHIFPHIFRGGYLGVDIFFVLSGFLMMRKFDSMNNISLKDSINSIKTRLFKLLPPLYTAVALALVISYFVSNKVFSDSISGLFPVILGYDNINQILKGASYFDKHGNFYLFTHLWTICLQLQFILVFTILNYILSKFKKDNLKIIAFGILYILSVFSMVYLTQNNYDITRIYYATDTRVSAFFLGAVTYLFFCKNIDMFKSYDNKLFKISKILILITIFISFIILDGEDKNVYLLYIHIFTLIDSILLTILYREEMTEISIGQNFIKDKISSILKYLGQRSYYIYIWQYMIGEIARYSFANIKMNKIFEAIFVILITLIISEINYSFFKVFSNKKNYFKYAICISLAVFTVISYLPVNDAFDREDLQESIEKNNKEIEEKNHNFKAKSEETSEETSNEETTEEMVKEDDVIEEENTDETLENLEIKEQEEVFKKDETQKKEKPLEEKQPQEKDSHKDKTKKENTEKKIEEKSEEKKVKNNNEMSKEKPAHNQAKTQENQAPPEKKKEEKVQNAPNEQNAPKSEQTAPASENKHSELKNISCTVVGDSVIINSDSYLRAKIPNLYLDGKVSRQLATGVKVLQNIKSSVGLGDAIVIALGSNGDFNIENLTKIRQIAESRPIIFVNCVIPDPWESSVNKKLQDFVASDENSYLVDWYSYAKNRKDIFYNDMTHPKPDGAKEYAELILNKLDEIF